MWSHLKKESLRAQQRISRWDPAKLGWTQSKDRCPESSEADRHAGAAGGERLGNQGASGSPEARRGEDAPTSFCWHLDFGLLASRTVRECIPGFFKWSFLKKGFYLFIIYLLAAPCGMRNLLSMTRNWTQIPCIGKQSPNHWTSGKSWFLFFFFFFIPVVLSHQVCGNSFPQP